MLKPLFGQFKFWPLCDFQLSKFRISQKSRKGNISKPSFSVNSGLLSSKWYEMHTFQLAKAFVRNGNILPSQIWSQTTTNEHVGTSLMVHPPTKFVNALTEWSWDVVNINRDEQICSQRNTQNSWDKVIKQVVNPNKIKVNPKWLNDYVKPQFFTLSSYISTHLNTFDNVGV